MSDEEIIEENIRRYIKEHSTTIKAYTQEYVDKKDKEIERLKEELQIEKATNKELLSTGADLESKLYEEQDKNKRLNNIIEKIKEYVYKPIDKEWDDILCIIEDGLRESDKE